MSEQRVADLERVLADLPMHIDDWEWARRNIDVLKTVPGMRFDTVLEIQIGRLVVNPDGTLTEKSA
jgi:hypothetical protein